jgi:transcriptional antiterminator NusG
MVHHPYPHENKVKLTLSTHRVDGAGRPTASSSQPGRIGPTPATVSKKIFPGYILVQMIELKEDDQQSNRGWFVVRNTPGVTGFVGSGNRPVSLEHDEVRRILRQMRVEEPRIKVGFAIGQSVRIVDGPFQDFVGQVDDSTWRRARSKCSSRSSGARRPWSWTSYRWSDSDSAIGRVQPGAEST